MKKHIFFIDPIEKLVVKKDSTLLMALSLKDKGYDVSLLFEKDFYFLNRPHKQIYFDVYSFEGNWNKKTFFVENFVLQEKNDVSLDKNCIIHMRLDPPFDARYLRYLWILMALERQTGVTILNSPIGIACNNEKLCVADRDDVLDIFVGSSWKQFIQFCYRQKKSHYRELVLKPLDLYQGIGIEKVSLDQGEDTLKSFFLEKIQYYKGPLILTPFLEEIYNGEIRSIYFDQKELGSMIKVPPTGSFLANVARGASFSHCQLTEKQRKACEEISLQFGHYGIKWLAFDLIGDYISEVNFTCPGLLVELSYSMEKNLAFDITSLLAKKD